MGGFAGPSLEDTTKTAGSLRRGACTIGTAYEGVRSFPAGDVKFL